MARPEGQPKRIDRIGFAPGLRTNGDRNVGRSHVAIDLSRTPEGFVGRKLSLEDSVREMMELQQMGNRAKRHHRK